MVPDPSALSRRQLLGGLAGGAGLGGSTVVAVGVTRPTALPNVLADWATTTIRRRPRRVRSGDRP
ncbi:hypothetical protein [Natrinema salaciae]|uniref:hypothetical protein n=1 Tax=Natrinema salaciae TaxID=1186196 RepID=UPI001FDF2E0A|nr:hypothetical protein [Natrinema salaciae]